MLLKLPLSLENEKHDLIERFQAEVTWQVHRFTWHQRKHELFVRVTWHQRKHDLFVRVTWHVAGVTWPQQEKPKSLDRSLKSLDRNRNMYFCAFLQGRWYRFFEGEDMAQMCESCVFSEVPTFWTYVAVWQRQHSAAFIDVHFTVHLRIGVVASDLFVHSEVLI